jgi:hypothetical protein
VTDQFGKVDTDDIGQGVSDEHLVFEAKQLDLGHARNLPLSDLQMATTDRVRHQLNQRTSGFLRPAGRK